MNSTSLVWGLDMSPAQRADFRARVPQPHDFLTLRHAMHVRAAEILGEIGADFTLENVNGFIRNNQEDLALGVALIFEDLDITWENGVAIKERSLMLPSGSVN